MNEEKILQPEQNYGPGNVLRAKREEYEWSVDAVAEALHLSTAAVKSIEADRYEDLPGATYVMGYWRSYARLLGINIEETIEANKRNLNVVTAEASGMDVIRPVHTRKSGGGGFGWLLILIALGAFGYYAWQQNFFGLLEKFQGLPGMDTEQSQPVEPVIEAAPKKVSKKDQMLRPLAASEIEPGTVATMPESLTNKDFPLAQPATAEGQISQADDSVVADTATVSGDQVSTSVNSASAGKRATGQTGLVLSSGSSATRPVETVVTPPVTKTAEQQSGDQPAAIDSTKNTISAQSDSGATGASPTGAASELILTVTRKTWINVRGIINKRMESRAGSVGDVIKVKGVPPFYVRVTPPDSVTVRYNGKNYPLPDKNNGVFASFKLDKTLQAL